MNVDWDSVTKVGKNTRPGGAKERVVKNQAQLNAARRTGAAVQTEKKFASANAKGSAEGQRLTKVDRSDDILKPKTVIKEMAEAVQKRRNELKLTQKQLATAANTTPTIIMDLERVGQPLPAQNIIAAVERKLNVRLQGSDIGSPKFGAPKKSPAEKRAEEEAKKKKKEEAERKKKEEEAKKREEEARKRIEAEEKKRREEEEKKRAEEEAERKQAEEERKKKRAEEKAQKQKEEEEAVAKAAGEVNANSEEAEKEEKAE